MQHSPITPNAPRFTEWLASQKATNCHFISGNEVQRNPAIYDMLREGVTHHLIKIGLVQHNQQIGYHITWL